MGKHPKRKIGAARMDEPMNGAMKLFLAGCAGEAYLLILRRFYINAHAALQIAWYDRYLWIGMGVGAAVMAAGLLGLLRRQAHPAWRQVMAVLAGAGGFVAAVSGVVRWNMDTVSVLTVLVPVIMLMGILWTLYDRTCALSLTILSVTLLSLVALRRYGGSLRYGTAVKILLALYAVALVSLALLLRQGRTPRLGRLGPLLPDKADPRAVYLACGMSCGALILSLVWGGLAYYALWVLAAAVFVLGVFYTVKQF